MVAIRLSDGTRVKLNTDLDTARKSWQQAVLGSQLLNITLNNGSIVSINPHHILYFEDKGH